MGFLDRITKTNWQNSPAHLFLLSRFLTPRAMEDFDQEHQEWEAALKEDPRRAIKRYMDVGFIGPGDLHGKLDHRFKLPELKELSRQYLLPESGEKDVLIERLIDADASGMEKLVRGIKVFRCTEKGTSIAMAYLNDEKMKITAVEQQAFGAIQDGNPDEACRLANSYHRQETIFPGVGGSASVAGTRRPSFLRSILSSRPRSLGKISKDLLKPLQIAVGMKYLFDAIEIEDWLPGDITLDPALDARQAAEMIRANSAYLNTLSGLKELGVKKARILVKDDACDSCQELKNKRYDINKVPELPYERCTCKTGCRCILATGEFFRDTTTETGK